MSHNDLTIAAACADLLFAARIRDAAAAAGRPVIMFTARDDVVGRVRAERPALVIIDLDARWLDGAAVIAALKREGGTAAIPVIAFAAHVRAEVLAAARGAGADRVLARSGFVRQLPGLLSGTG